MAVIKILPLGITCESRKNQTLLDVILGAGIKIASICGGNGSCGRCLVELHEGGVVYKNGGSEKLIVPAEGKEKKVLLACMVRPTGDCTVFIPKESMDDVLKAQTDYTGPTGSTDRIPGVNVYEVSIEPPDLHDIRSDADRILDALSIQSVESIDYRVLWGLSSVVRKNDWHVSAVVLNKELIRIGPIGSTYTAVAVDIGTTKCAVYLLDPVTGKKIDAEGVINPQTSYGADVISRLSNIVEKPELGGVLQKLLVDEINSITHELCRRNGLSSEDIVFSVFVGNTAMHHLFLKLEVHQLINAPFVPAAAKDIFLKSRELGLAFSPGGYAYCLPNIAGYVGADHVGMLLASNVLKNRQNVLYIDIGTNTEMCLATPGRLYSLSAPSGPAFEGAHIRFGMRAVPGAIDSFSIDASGTPHYTTIENKKAKGICGSGILDIITEAYKAGIIDWRGRLLEHDMVRTVDAKKRFRIAAESETDSGEEIFLTQQDVREFQLVKGTITAGIHVLAETAAIGLKEITSVKLAGAFGFYINVENALFLGMFPFPKDTAIQQVGNAAGEGACMAAVDSSVYTEIQRICTEMQYIELVNAPGFKKTYARGTYLGNKFMEQEK